MRVPCGWVDDDKEAKQRRNARDPFPPGLDSHPLPLGTRRGTFMGRLSCASGLRTLSGYILGGEASGWPRTDLLRSICLPLLPSSSLQPVPIILSRSFCTCLTVRTPTLWGNRASAQSAMTPESLTQSRGALSGLQGPIQRASFNPGDVSANFGSPQEALLDASSFLKMAVLQCRSLEALARATKGARHRGADAPETQGMRPLVGHQENAQEDAGEGTCDRRA